MNITATTSPAFQQVQSARLDRQTGNNQGQEIQQYNISTREHNNSFLHTPQVRSAGLIEQANPQSSAPPLGRGGVVDFSA